MKLTSKETGDRLEEYGIYTEGLCIFSKSWCHYRKLTELGQDSCPVRGQHVNMLLRTKNVCSQSGG